MSHIVVRLDMDLAVTHHGPFSNKVVAEKWVEVQQDTSSIFQVEPLYDPREGYQVPGRMNSVIKAEWLRRLRSGTFKQGKNYLKYITPDGKTLQCCLGLLVDMAVEAGVIPAPILVPFLGNRVYLYEATTTDRSWDLAVYDGGPHVEGILPHEVRAWAGLNDIRDYDPAMTSDCRSLSDYNDIGRLRLLRDRRPD